MSTRSTTCEKSVTIDYPEDNIKVKVSRRVYPEERYHKAIGYFLEQIMEGGDL